MDTPLKTLIVDDEPQLRKSVISVLESLAPQYKFDITECENGALAVQMAQTQAFDLILMDVRMPELDGLSALEVIKKHDARVFIVIMTAHANLQDAINAIKSGAYDYVEKPVDPEKVKKIVLKALETRELVSRLALSNPIFDDDIDSEFVGSSKKMRGVFDIIYKLSHVDTTVLIRGENGTGKELVAKAIHHNSPRKHGEFVAINCGAIPESLMESELFGHERGAFTGAIERKLGMFQLANRGTIFLDEIGELRPEMQVKLLRVLQEKTFMPIGGNREVKTNARVIAATNQNLEKMIEESTFREDLFYRLNVMPIFLPPLRDRIDDLEDLVRFFMKKFSKKIEGRKIFDIEPAALKALKAYQWPGNIRELENIVERAFIVESGPSITLEGLPEVVQKVGANVEIPTRTGSYNGPLDFDLFKEEMEKEFIIKALQSNLGKINKTVAHAGIPKNTLLRKIKKYGINVKEYISEGELED